MPPQQMPEGIDGLKPESITDKEEEGVAENSLKKDDANAKECLSKSSPHYAFTTTLL